MYAQNVKMDIVARDARNQFQLSVFKLVFVSLNLDFTNKTTNLNLVSIYAPSVQIKVAVQDVMNKNRF